MTLSVVAISESSVTTLPEDLADAVRERYGFEKVVCGDRLAGGYANDIFRLDADGSPYVVRMQRRPVDVAGLAWEHRLLTALAPRLAEAVAPIRATDGSTFFKRADEAIVVLPYVDGAPAEPARDRTAAAEALARFHRAAADIHLPPRPGLVRLAELRDGINSGRYFEAIGPRANPVPRRVAGRAAEMQAALDWALNFVEQFAQRPPKTAPIHADVFRGNILVRDGRVVAIVDWEEANVDWVAYDLANATWEFCGYDETVSAEFIRAYRAAGGTVPAAEDELLIPLVRLRRILELIRAPYDREVDWDYQLANLDAFERLG
jgi:Ser/Thr protein kinase RdoA (MazF antagonist)